MNLPEFDGFYDHGCLLNWRERAPSRSLQQNDRTSGSHSLNKAGRSIQPRPASTLTRPGRLPADLEAVSKPKLDYPWGTLNSGKAPPICRWRVVLRVLVKLDVRYRAQPLRICD